MEVTRKFFELLAGRFRKENDLSDITWAICESCPCFRSIWLRYFFGDAIDINDVESIEREVVDVVDGSSRVDFAVYMKGGKQKFIIENKIYDTNHHFDTYEKAFQMPSGEYFGYITNYPIEDKQLCGKKYQVRHWRDFYFHLKKVQGVPPEDRDLIDGYCEYVKNICGIMTPDNIIDLNKLTSLRDLSLALMEGLNKDTDLFSSEYYKCSYENREGFRRYYFKLTYKGINEKWRVSYPYWGIWFDNNNPRIVFGFDPDSGWCKNLCVFLEKNSSSFEKVKLMTCSRIKKGVGYYFELSNDAAIRFAEADNVKKQLSILDDFFTEAVSFPLRLYSVSTDKQAQCK